MATVQDIPELLAVHSALQYARALIQEDPDNPLNLEAIERSEDGKYWLVTVGYWQQKPRSLLEKQMEKYKSETRGIVLRLPSAEMIKVYKIIKVDAATYESISMTLREHD